MSLSEVVVEGTLKPDGTLELNEKPNVPAGRVQVIVQALPELPNDDPFWQRMQAMWDARKIAGDSPRSVEKTESELRQMGDEWEEHQRALERLQYDGRQAQEEPKR